MLQRIGWGVLLSLIAAMCCVVGAGQAAYGQPVLDQKQEASPLASDFNRVNGMGQTFTVGSAGVLDSIEVKLAKSGTQSDTVHFALFASAGDLPTGDPLASVDLRIADIPAYVSPGDLSFVKIDLRSFNIPVLRGQKLAMTLLTNDGGPNYVNYYVGASNDDPYAAGVGFWQDYGRQIWFNEGTRDLAFRMYVQPTGGTDYLYWTGWDRSTGSTQYVVRRAKTDGAGIETLTTLPANVYASGIAVDVAGGHIFYGVEKNGGPANIVRANLDGSNPVNIISAYTLDLQLDLVHGKIYWSNTWQPNLNDRGIFRANLDGTNVEKLRSFGSYDGVYGLAVDPVAGKVYYTWNPWPQPLSVWSCNLDGSSPAVVIPAPIGPGDFVDKLAVDSGAGKFYLSMRFPGLDSSAVYRRNADSTGAATAVSSSGYVFAAMCLDSASKHVFFSKYYLAPDGNVTDSDIFRVNADGTAETELSTLTLGGIYYMTVAKNVPTQAVNQDPIAVAGADQTVSATGPLTTVSLDGSGSFDPDGDAISFEWSLPEGSAAVLDDPNSPTPTGHFPVGDTLVTLMVTDELGGESTDDVLITVVNRDPVAVPGDDQRVPAAGPLTSVSLDGSASSDPDGNAIEFEWSVPEGSGATLDDPTSATPTGQFPVGPTLVTLTVTDGLGGVATDDVLITVVDTTPPVVICTTDKAMLWPPNHQIEQVVVSIQASDVVTAANDLLVYATVASSERDDAKGDGSFTGDVNGQDGFTAPVPITLMYDPTLARFVGVINLRAERDGTQRSRTYSIVAKAIDGSGNFSTASCVVVVPHDRKK